MKLIINEIAPYLPYGLKCNADDDYNDDPIINGELFRIETGKTTHNNSTFDPYVIIDDNEYELHCIKPILTRVEDMSEEQKIEWVDIIQLTEDNMHFSVKSNKFFYSNHIDIHNLIDSELAIDAKTIRNE